LRQTETDCGRGGLVIVISPVCFISLSRSVVHVLVVSKSSLSKRSYLPRQLSLFIPVSRTFVNSYLFGNLSCLLYRITDLTPRELFYRQRTLLGSAYIQLDFVSLQYDGIYVRSFPEMETCGHSRRVLSISTGYIRHCLSVCFLVPFILPPWRPVLSPRRPSLAHGPLSSVSIAVNLFPWVELLKLLFLPKFMIPESKFKVIGKAKSRKFILLITIYQMDTCFQLYGLKCTLIMFP